MIAEGQGQADMSAQPGLALTSDDAVPPLPSKSMFRKLSSASRGTANSKKSPPRSSGDTLPPEYAKYNWTSGSYFPRDTDKAERLYQNDRIAKRGGWGRLLLLLAILAVVAIALGVGLGVGLTHHKSSSSATTSPSDTPSAADLGFPVGEYSINTALRSVQTNCTSNAATWRCPPYTTYSASDSSSASASLTTFNWILSNTSATYISNTSLPQTDANGIAANLSISSSANPFSISFTNQSLMYYNNDNQPRYEFNYTMSQKTIPSAALTTDNSASICFYNDTMLMGTLYLSSAVSIDFPTANSSSLGSYESWPFAVRVEQVAAGGANVPACYETTNGVLGQRITAGFTQEPASDECVCDYRNYKL